MALNAAPDTTLDHRANLNIAAAVVAKLGVGATDSLIGRVINDVRASHPVAQLASAGGMAAVIGAVDTAIARSAEAGKPQNLYDANAARAAQQPGAPTRWASLNGDDRPFDRFQRLAAQRDREASCDGGSSDSRSSSSARYDGMVSDWGTPRGLALTRSYAASNDMGWAMKDPDLMRMGKPALQALKESGLKGDGYQALRSPKNLGFDNPTIVNGAEYMKRNNIDYNKSAKASAEVDKGLKGEDKDEHKDLLKKVYNTRGEPSRGADRAKREFRDAASGWKARNPHMAPKIDNELEQLRILQQSRNEAKLKSSSIAGTPSTPTTLQQPERNQVAANQDIKAKNRSGLDGLVVR